MHNKLKYRQQSLPANLRCKREAPGHPTFHQPGVAACRPHWWVKTRGHLKVVLAATVFGQAVMKVLFWVEMLRTSTLPAPGTVLNASQLYHLLPRARP